MSAADLRAFLASLADAEAPAITAGFDAFVDEILHVVDQRHDLEHYDPVPSLVDMGALFSAAAGHSACRELVPLRHEAGGCAVNLGDAIQALGLPLNYAGALGDPLPACFEPFAAGCAECLVWGSEPGRTLAFEFNDGKFLLPATTQFTAFDAAHLRRCLADGRYLRMCQRSRVIVLTAWSLFPHLSECWRVLAREVFPQLTHRPWCTVDLIDPSSRAPAAIDDMLAVLRDLETQVRVAFSGNLNEVNRIAARAGVDAVTDIDDPAALAEQATALRAALGISAVVTHARGCAVAADHADTATCRGVICPSPRKSTGAGDRFNAGVSAGLAVDAPWSQCLAAGTACSGFFVRHARSPSRAELVTFAEHWQADILDRPETDHA